MALKACHECKGQISTTAKACPHCGAAVKKPPSVVGGIAGGLLLVFMAFVIFGGSKAPPPAQKTPEQQAAEEKFQQESAEDAVRVCSLRSAMKNPDSFKVVRVVRGSAGQLCVQYRATNSFNAVTTESVRFPAPGKGAPSPTSACDANAGEDVTKRVELDLKFC